MLLIIFVLIFMVLSEVLKIRNKEIFKWNLLNIEKEFKDICIDFLKLLLKFYFIYGFCNLF